jgi:curved DNA-binding protein CbpA
MKSSIHHLCLPVCICADKVGTAHVERFIEIQEAYQVLSDPDTRRKYDSFDSGLLREVARRRKMRREKWKREQQEIERKQRENCEWMFQEWWDDIEVEKLNEIRNEEEERENKRREWKKQEQEMQRKQREMIESMMADTLALREHNLQEAHGGR